VGYSSYLKAQIRTELKSSGWSVETRKRRLVDAIARGEVIESLLIQLKAEEHRARLLPEQIRTLSKGWNLIWSKGFEVIAIGGGGLVSGMQRCMARKRAQTLRDNSNRQIRKSYSWGSQDLFGGYNLLDTHLGFVSMFPYRLPSQHYDS